MKIRMIGKTTGTVGNSSIQVRGSSGRKFLFNKTPGQGYTYDTKDDSEAEEIFNTQGMRLAYFFTPILGEGETKKPVNNVPEFEGKSLEELKEICKELGIQTLPQDKERSLTRLLESFKLGAGA